MKRFKEWWAEARRKPWLAHVLRMQERFSNRLGNQFAGAITYFSMLALVPMLMFAFAALGFTLTVVRPELLQQVHQAVAHALSGMGTGLQDKIGALIDNFLNNWGAIGIVGLLSAIYSAAGWAGNLKSAIRAQIRPDFDLTEHKHNIAVETLIDIALLLGLLVLIPLTFALANLSTTLTGWLIQVLHLGGIPGIGVTLRVVGPLASAAAGWLLFYYLLSAFPQERFSFRPKAWAALIGSIGLAVLQYLGSFLVGTFLGNPAAALFGPVIVLMLFLNLFARLILYTAAWMATAIQPANPVRLQDIDEPLAEVPESGVTAGEIAAAEPERATGKKGGGHPGDAEPSPVVHAPGSSGHDVPAQVSRLTAIRNGQASLRVGWVTGAATGIGVGAVLAAMTGFAARFMPGGRRRE